MSVAACTKSPCWDLRTFRLQSPRSPSRLCSHSRNRSIPNLLLILIFWNPIVSHLIDCVLINSTKSVNAQAIKCTFKVCVHNPGSTSSTSLHVTRSLEIHTFIFLLVRWQIALKKWRYICDKHVYLFVSCNIIINYGNVFMLFNFNLLTGCHFEDIYVISIFLLLFALFVF